MPAIDVSRKIVENDGVLPLNEPCVPSPLPFPFLIFLSLPPSRFDRPPDSQCVWLWVRERLPKGQPWSQVKPRKTDPFKLNE